MAGTQKRFRFAFYGAVLLQCITFFVKAQNCNVNFPGTASATYSAACGGTSSNLTLGSATFMGNGDVFTFNSPATINISGNLTVNAEGSAKIVIPAGVTVNVDGNFNLNSRNGGCTSGSPCGFVIEVQGKLHVSNNFQNSLSNLIWFGAGEVVVDHNFRNDNNGCIQCASSGCPTFGVRPSDCQDQNVSCSGNFCATLNRCAPDILAPVISGCPTNITVSNDPGQCTKVVRWTEPTASDNCTLLSFRSVPVIGSPFPVGTTPVTYTAVDDQGNTTTCSFNVTVNDTELPVIACPANITVNADPGQCSKVVSWTAPLVSDNCTVMTPTSVPASGSVFQIGTTKVVYTVLDNHGNKATCSFDVTVNDVEVPVITGCPANLSVTADAGQCSKIVTWAAAGATDNCIVTPPTAVPPSGSTFQVGKTTVVYTAVDNHGNISNCTFEVEVKNSDPPVITGCPEDITLEANENGVAYPQWTPPTATAACGDVDVVGSHQPNTPFKIGETTVEYEATDIAGNSALCTFHVVVNEGDVDIKISQVVTPDGDGTNDKWTITNIEQFENNEVEIVDRWGGLVYKATKYNNDAVSWSGVNRKGQLVPTGTYYYTILINFGSKKVKKTGFIEVIH